MEKALQNQIVAKLEKLPRTKIIEVMDFIDFLLSRKSTVKEEPIEATDKEILRAAEAGGSLDFYYDSSQDVYTLEDGEPL